MGFALNCLMVVDGRKHDLFRAGQLLFDTIGTAVAAPIPLQSLGVQLPSDTHVVLAGLHDG